MRISDWSSDVCSSDLDQRPVALPQPLERRHIHMVVMIVAEEHDVDLRQIIEPYARRPHPFRPREGEGRGAFRPDRVGQYVEALGLHEHRRMAHPCDGARADRSEEHTSELQSLMRISYAVFCLKKQHFTTITKCTNQTLQKQTTKQT